MSTPFVQQIKVWTQNGRLLNRLYKQDTRTKEDIANDILWKALLAKQKRYEKRAKNNPIRYILNIP